MNAEAIQPGAIANRVRTNRMRDKFTGYARYGQIADNYEEPSLIWQCNFASTTIVASRRTRGPIDNISFGAPVWLVTNHRGVFRILRVFRVNDMACCTTMQVAPTPAVLIVGVSRLSVMFIYFNVTYLQLHTTDWQIKCIELN